MLSHLDFPRPHMVEGRASISNIFSPGSRRGIYILHFSNQEMYVGQSEDVTRRYVQHRIVHSDIVSLTFKRVARRNLDEAEQSVIHSLEREGKVLRNIALSSMPKGEADFDLVMSLGDQAHWLDDASYVDIECVEGARVKYEGMRSKYRAKYELLAGSRPGPAIIEILRRYVQVGLPAFRRSEVEFWSCSCLPYSPKNPDISDNKVGIGLCSRVNVNWQEVLTITEPRELPGVLRTSFHLARTPIEAAFGSSAGSLVALYPTARLGDHKYKPGGYDQLNLNIDGATATLKLLEDPDVIRAIRLFNLRLMKKGPCVYARNHCMDLADRLMG